MRRYKLLWIYFNMWRIIPAFLCTKVSKHQDKIKMDICIWKKKLLPIEHQGHSDVVSFGMCLFLEKAFRNVMLNRLHRNPIAFAIFRCLFSPLDSLYINMPPENIGGGLYIQHGFSTIIAAKSIGQCCHINQQVTIGYNGSESSIIGNNVTVTAGAIVIGNVSVGDNSIIGAGTVVTKDVPERAIVVGSSARILKVKQNGDNINRNNN